MSKETTAKLHIFIAMFLFGTIGVFVRHIALPSALIALCRGTIGMAFLLVVLLFRHQKLCWQAVKANAWWLLLSSIALGFNWILLFEAYRFTTVAAATLCYYMAPILIILVSPMFLKENLTMKKFLCVLAALIGMVCISGVFRSGCAVTGGFKGILLGLAAAVLYATVVLLNKQLRGIDAFDRTILQLGISALVLLPYCLLTLDLSGLTLDAPALGMLLFVGIVHTGVTYLLYFGALEHTSGQTAAIISYVDPVVAVLASVLILAEPMTLTDGIGAILILGAAFVSEVNLKRKKVQP